MIIQIDNAFPFATSGYLLLFVNVMCEMMFEVMVVYYDYKTLGVR